MRTAFAFVIFPVKTPIIDVADTVILEFFKIPPVVILIAVLLGSSTVIF